jgi:hypothetical protein
MVFDQHCDALDIHSAARNASEEIAKIIEALSRLSINSGLPPSQKLTRLRKFC